MSAPAFNAAGLSDAVLEAASSKGLLRRAQRDRAAGLARVTARDAGGVVVAVDGETVRLDAGGLARASCTCPARETCRHVLAAVLELRDGAAAGADAVEAREAPAAPPAADPVAEILALSAADLVKAFGRGGLKGAEAILAAAALPGDETGGVRVEAADGACLIRIAGQPDVHYLAGHGPGGMVSKTDDESAKRLHAAALLALRRLRAGEPAARPATEAGPDEEPGASAPARAQAAFLDAVAEGLREAARSALASAPAVLEERLLDLAVSSRADALPNLAGALRAIAADMERRRQRATQFEPGEALAGIARAYALVEALRRDGDDPRLRGSVREAYAERDALDLIGCGVTLWQARTGARGVTAHLVAPDAGEGTRWFTLSLARAAGQDPSFIPLQAASSEPVWGRTLDGLGREAFRLHAPRVGADGRLSTGAQARVETSGDGWREAVSRVPDLVLSDWSDLAGRVGQSLRPSLRRSPRSVQPLLLAPSRIGPARFDAVTQEASLPVRDREGRWLELQVEGEADLERRLDILCDAGPEPILVVLARAEGQHLVLSPIALSRDGLTPLLHLDVPSKVAEQKPPEPRRGALALGASLLGRLGLRRPEAAARFVQAGAQGEATGRLLAAAEDETLALAELGGRMEDAERAQRIGLLAGRLESSGLSPLAGPLARLAAAPVADRPHHLLVFTHALACHRRLAPAVPFLTEHP